jgi:ribosome-associated protein
MNIQQLQALVIDALEDVKAQDIKLFDTAHLSNMFERLVVASGTSNRQTRALAVSVRDKVKQAGGMVIGMEGEDTGEWVLVDLGDMVVHIMQAPIRAYYRLEELWGERAISLDDAKRLAKAKAPAKGKAKAGAKDEGSDEVTTATAAAPPAAKPKRATRLSNSAVEALEKPKKPRKSAGAATTGDDAAPAPRSRSRKAADTDAPAPRAPRTRKSADPTAPAPARARRIVVAETLSTQAHKASKAAAAPKPAAKPRVRKPVADSSAGTAPHTPRARKSRTPSEE